MSRTFRQACQQAEFGLTKDLNKADIIFAHSGGALLLPAEPSAKLLVLVGIAFWPGRTWLAATRKHLQAENRAVWAERRVLYWLHKWGWRAVYFWKLPTTIKMKRNQNIQAPWNSTAKQIVVRNREDEYSMPNMHEQPFKGPRTFISLPGSHDDCWDNPQPYVDLIQSLYYKPGSRNLK